MITNKWDILSKCNEWSLCDVLDAFLSKISGRPRIGTFDLHILLYFIYKEYQEQHFRLYSWLPFPSYCMTTSMAKFKEIIEINRLSILYAEKFVSSIDDCDIALSIYIEVHFKVSWLVRATCDIYLIYSDFPMSLTFHLLAFWCQKKNNVGNEWWF